MSVLSNILRPIKNRLTNMYVQAFYSAVGVSVTRYPDKYRTYLDEGYGENPVVFSVVNQQATKTASIPYYIKRVSDKQTKYRLDSLKRLTKGIYTPQQEFKRIIMESKAYEEKTLDFPMERPNVLQTWTEIMALYKTYLALTGNVYFYMYRTTEKEYNSPLQIYILPSYVQIVLKKDADMLGDESPIDHYILVEGQQYVKFMAEDIIHIKLPNPFYDINGSHLYGLSRLRAALRNIQSSNVGIDQNIKTLANSGAFGFIHGKTTPLTPTQANELKDRLREMDSSPERLAKISGMSAEVGFTRISLTTEELQPFEYLKFDEKQMCNVLGWSDKLLNNDEGAKYDNIKEFRQQVITDNIMPDLKLLEEAFNSRFLPLFKGYDNCVMEFDPSELPEMQMDMAKLVEWLSKAKADGAINTEEYRIALRYPESGDPNMKIHTVSTNCIPLSEAVDPEFGLDDQELI